MRSYTSTLFAAVLAASHCSALDVPDNVQSLYDSIKAASSCSNTLSDSFRAEDDGPQSFYYCGDHLDDYGIVYLQGDGGALADMDIDCDGEQNGKGDDGRCGESGDTQPQTSFMDTVASYNKGISDLNAYIHPYVVFGNDGSKGSFDPQSQGIQPLSLMAVVCGNGQMYYGIWGDSNGDDGEYAVIGESSISMGTFCFGADNINGNSGHEETDVLYIAFTGDDAVPGADGANWNADSPEDFESSLQSLGDTLIQRIGGTSTSPPPPTPTCSWEGHCEGASCSTDDDCSDDLYCNNGSCTEP